MSTAGRYLPHYTVADYEQWEGDWELWQGIPVAMSPSPFGPHQNCSLRIARSLLAAIEAAKCQAVVLQEVDWIISDDTVVRPDVLVLCGGVPERHVTQSPALIVEILSPSTADRDRNEKLGLYHFGMWVDDLDAAEKRVVDAGGKYLAGRPTSPNSFYEAKYQSPTGLVFDLTHKGWAGAVKDVVPTQKLASAK